MEVFHGGVPALSKRWIPFTYRLMIIEVIITNTINCLIFHLALSKKNNYISLFILSNFIEKKQKFFYLPFYPEQKGFSIPSSAFCC